MCPDWQVLMTLRVCVFVYLGDGFILLWCWCVDLILQPRAPACTRNVGAPANPELKVKAAGLVFTTPAEVAPVRSGWRSLSWCFCSRWVLAVDPRSHDVAGRPRSSGDVGLGFSSELWLMDVAVTFVGVYTGGFSRSLLSGVASELSASEKGWWAGLWPVSEARAGGLELQDLSRPSPASHRISWLSALPLLELLNMIPRWGSSGKLKLHKIPHFWLSWLSLGAIPSTVGWLRGSCFVLLARGEPCSCATASGVPAST